MPMVVVLWHDNYRLLNWDVNWGGSPARQLAGITCLVGI
jgi:hypothetical protein